MRRNTRHGTTPTKVAVETRQTEREEARRCLLAEQVAVAKCTAHQLTDQERSSILVHPDTSYEWRVQRAGKPYPHVCLDVGATLVTLTEHGGSACCRGRCIRLTEAACVWTGTLNNQVLATKATLSECVQAIEAVLAAQDIPEKGYKVVAKPLIEREHHEGLIRTRSWQNSCAQ